MNRDETIGVGFDVDHTIAIDNKLERVAFLRLLEFVAKDGGRRVDGLENEIQRIDELLERQRDGSFSIDEAVRRFVAERGVSGRDDFYVETFRTMAVEMVDQFVIPLPEAQRTFSALRARGVRIAVLSNGWNPLQVRKARRVGFDAVVLASGDIGARKPNRRAFEALIAALGTPPERTWYVGDDPLADIEGARQAGLNAVWMDAENATFPPELRAPLHTIHALDEILELVAAGTRG
jgi:HAD superfamily hydrolase (TIGR01509 family)